MSSRYWRVLASKALNTLNGLNAFDKLGAPLIKDSAEIWQHEPHAASRAAALNPAGDGPERGHSCPQQAPNARRFGLCPRPRPTQDAAPDRNVRAPIALPLFVQPA